MASERVNRTANIIYIAFLLIVFLFGIGIMVNALGIQIPFLPDPIVGQWTNIDNPQSTFVFNNDGTLTTTDMSATYMASTYSGTWYKFSSTYIIKVNAIYAGNLKLTDGAQGVLSGTPVIGMNQLEIIWNSGVVERYKRT